MPVLDFRQTPLYADALPQILEEYAGKGRPPEEGETFSTETAPSQSPELERLLGCLAQVTLEGLSALGVSDASERPFEVTHLWMEGHAAGAVRPASSRDAAALVGILVLEGTATLELHNPQEAQRQRLFGKATLSPMLLPASPGQYFLLPGWLQLGSQPFDSSALLVVWTVAEVASTLAETRPRSLRSLTQAASPTPLAPTPAAADAVLLRFGPALGSSWLCRIHTSVEVGNLQTEEKQRKESRMTSREEIIARHAEGLIKKVDVLECSEPLEQDSFQGASLQVLCTPRGEQTLLLGESDLFPAGPPLFPEGPVRPGDTWPVVMDCTLPGKQALRGTGHFDSLQQGLARLLIQTTSETLAAGSVISTGKQKLNLLVEIDTGVCRQSDVEVQEEIHPASGPPMLILTTTRIELTSETALPSVDRSCAACGQSVPADANFCHQCGKPMAA